MFLIIIESLSAAQVFSIFTMATRTHTHTPFHSLISTSCSNLINFNWISHLLYQYDSHLIRFSVVVLLSLHTSNGGACTNLSVLSLSFPHSFSLLSLSPAKRHIFLPSIFSFASKTKQISQKNTHNKKILCQKTKTKISKQKPKPFSSLFVFVHRIWMNKTHTWIIAHPYRSQSNRRSIVDWRLLQRWP